VHYGEGVAIRIGPEPCVGIREGVGEVSAREHTGQPLSRVSLIVPSADVFEITEGNMADAPARVFSQPGVVEDPGMCGSSLRGNREICAGAVSNGPPYREQQQRPLCDVFFGRAEASR